MATNNQVDPTLQRSDTLILLTNGPKVPNGTLAASQVEPIIAKKRKLIDFSAATVVDPEGREVLLNEFDAPNGQEDQTEPAFKWQLVYDKVTLTQGNGIAGFVYKLGQNPLDDVCVQWIKKYGKMMLHVGPFKISMARACPETMVSESYLAKKGVSILSADNLEALYQLLPTLMEEKPYLEEILAKRSKSL